MKKQISQKIQIQEGITCEYNSGILRCKKEGKEAQRKLQIPSVQIKIEDNSIILECKKANQKIYKTIISHAKHIKNIFSGLNENFVYKLEAVNVHFPMSLKVENGFLIIKNFLGEKEQRKAKILNSVEVVVKGNQVTVSSHNKEFAGQTAANIEKSAKVSGRDRRIYQDGIFIVEKPKGVKNE